MTKYRFTGGEWCAATSPQDFVDSIECPSQKDGEKFEDNEGNSYTLIIIPSCTYAQD